MEALFYIIEFTLLGLAVGIIIHCLKDKDKQKKFFNKITLGRVGWAIAAAMVIIYSVSWIVTCGIIKLITLFLGLEFSWLVATVIWLVISLIRWIFRRK